MSTWARGRALALAAIRRDGVELEPFVAALGAEALARVPRTAVYAVADPATVPQALLHNLKHNQVLHERNVILTVQFVEQPVAAEAERVQLESLGHDFWRVTLRFGFMETPDVPQALQACAARGLEVPPAATSFFLSRETIVPTAGPGMAPWRERLFATMSRNAGSVVEFFRLPDNAVVELGTRVQI
jgi:KUP system potassium uptake protein